MKLYQRLKQYSKKIVPSALFDYKFVDGEYAKKFGQEERIGKLASLFAILAIFIFLPGIVWG